MCSNGETPAVAAYAVETGKFKWATCAADGRYREVVAATDRTVYVRVGSYPEQTVVALDAANGRDEPSAPPPPAGSTDTLSCYAPPGMPSRAGYTAPDCGGALSAIVVGDTRLVGGQDDPTTAFDASSGAKRWEHPGSTVYDGVWAAGAGAVYVVDRRSEPGVARLVAYDLKSGAVRWERKLVDPYGADMGWPWYASDRGLFTIWSNLVVLSTKDGATLWRTNYPVERSRSPGVPSPSPGVPARRMTGVRANSSTVFVAFSKAPSGGD